MQNIAHINLKLLLKKTLSNQNHRTGHCIHNLLSNLVSYFSLFRILKDLSNDCINYLNL